MAQNRKYNIFKDHSLSEHNYFNKVLFSPPIYIISVNMDIIQCEAGFLIRGTHPL